jgi:VRR-NUC domain
MSTRFSLSDLPPHYAKQAQAQMQPKALPHAPGRVDFTEDVSSPTPADKTPPRAGKPLPRGRPVQQESALQQAVIVWWRSNCYEWRLDEELLMAFPLAGKRTPRNASRMKAEGMRRGTPDLLLAAPRGDCASLWIEMKTPGGYLNPFQKLMLKRLTIAGNATVVCRSTSEACDAIRCYLNLPRRNL